MFMTLPQAAEVLGISLYELRRGINAGEYPALPIGTGRRRKADPEQIKPILLEKAFGRQNSAERVSYGRVQRP